MKGASFQAVSPIQQTLAIELKTTQKKCFCVEASGDYIKLRL
jgi:hypothetical protein